MPEKERIKESGTAVVEDECRKEEEKENLAQEKLKTSARKRKNKRIRYSSSRGRVPENKKTPVPNTDKVAWF